jgi:transposase
MGKKRFSVESIVSMLREADVLIGQGHSVPEILKHLGISDVTYYRWRKDYGGMKV